MSGIPTEGKGLRKLDCDFYGVCLDFASKKKWDTFHCGSCQGPEAEDTEHVLEEKPESQNLCKECGKKPRLGSSPYCASCMAIRGNKAKAAQKATQEQKKQRQGKAPVKSGEAHKKPDTALAIEFGKHASILREVEALAEKEIRPVECQIIYMLKWQLIGEKMKSEVLRKVLGREKESDHSPTATLPVS